MGEQSKAESVVEDLEGDWLNTRSMAGYLEGADAIWYRHNGFARFADTSECLVVPAGHDRWRLRLSIQGNGRDNALTTYLVEHSTLYEMNDWSSRDVLANAVETGWTINKYADPEEDAREGLSVDEADQICRYADSDLIWLSK